jgi:molybdenum cofactor synthesis domain-containing protein
VATSLARALEIVGEHVTRLDAETVGLAAARGRVLAEELTSPLNLPPFDNSAMDGYAVVAADTTDASATEPVRLTVLGDARAGAPYNSALSPGSAVRIATGAMLPHGSDAVLRVEDAERDGDDLLIAAPLTPSKDVRPAGDDLKAGTKVLSQGTRLGAGELAMLASTGHAEVSVVRRPLVAIIGTGDELVAPGDQLGPGQIYDSNMPMLAALVTEAGAEVASAAIRVADTLDATVAALETAVAAADLVLISGGVSKGAHDHVKPALEQIGAEQIFWQLALRPGHPTWFGVKDSVPVFGLPGNPASSYVVFHVLAAQAIALLGGSSAEQLEVDAVYHGPTQTKRQEMVQVVRCSLKNADGQLVAAATGAHQRSHAVSSLVHTDGLILLAAECTALADGDPVRVRLTTSRNTA